MASIGGSQNEAFGAGVQHLANPGRMNTGSITLGGLQTDADRWSNMTPHSVIQGTPGGSPADTDAAIQWGQESLGDQSDTAMAGQSINRMMMSRAAGIGQDDNTA